MKTIYTVILSLLCLCLLPGVVYGDSFEANATYSVCFTPGGDCTQNVVDSINNAVNAIWVQAYTFTSHPIQKALVDAKQRGVNVQVILDKDALQYNQNLLNYFKENNIPVWIDYQPTIAHNKVMIIDQTRVITGSFNFTYAAQNKNAENLLIIDDEGLAKKYLQNWQNRQRASNPYSASMQTNSSWWSQFWDWLVSWVKSLF